MHITRINQTDTSMLALTPLLDHRSVSQRNEIRIRLKPSHATPVSHPSLPGTTIALALSESVAEEEEEEGVTVAASWTSAVFAFACPAKRAMPTSAYVSGT